MERMKIQKSRLTEWVSKLQETAKVYAPVQEGDTTCFGLLPTGAEPIPEGYGNTDRPMKEVLFPQDERIVSWTRTPEGLEVSEVDEAEPTVIFGARPCDVTAVNVLDRAFSLGGIVDPYYTNRREKTTIISLVCAHPVPSCFGPSAGVNELSPEGADVVLAEVDDAYITEIKTDNGKAAVEAGGDAFSAASEDDINAAAAAGETLVGELKEQELALDGSEARADALLESEEWDQIWQRCLSCGICAFLCPACHCFDICDQAAKGGGDRIRCYDTCSSKIYTKQAAGHNPRPTAKERLTQRVMHKFSYIPQRMDGLLGCVGCARCRKCPVDIDLQVALSEVEVEAKESE